MVAVLIWRLDQLDHIPRLEAELVWVCFVGQSHCQKGIFSP